MYIWYASYGSNLLEERFLCYIRGGIAPGTKRLYRGCSDRSLPAQSGQFRINRQLYFAQHSTTWNGGVAFIGNQTEKEARTLGRIYLITLDQFKEVLKQELDFEGDLSIDIGQLTSLKELTVKEQAWYGKVVYLGDQKGMPVFSFTHQTDLSPAKPGLEYLKVIMSGIEEVYSLQRNEIINYLLTAPGLQGNYSYEDLACL